MNHGRGFWAKVVSAMHYAWNVGRLAQVANLDTRQDATSDVSVR